jgi:hypothetical protein
MTKPIDRGDRGAGDAERRKGASADDQQRIQSDVQHDRGAEEDQRRPGVARRPEGGLRREEPEHERRAQQVRRKVETTEFRDLGGRLHHREEGRRQRPAGGADEDTETESHGEGRAGHDRREAVGALTVTARRHRGEPDRHHLRERREHPDRESRSRDGGQCRGPEDAADPEGVHEQERELEQRGPDRGEGEADDRAAERPADQGRPVGPGA